MVNSRINLNAHVLEALANVLGPACHEAASGFFDDATGHAAEMATVLEKKILDNLVERYQSSERDRGTISSVEDLGSIYNVRQLRQATDGVDDDRMVMCQVVGQDSGVWNVHLTASKLKEGSEFLILTASHPDLDHLPGGRNADDRNAVITKLIDDLNKLR